MIERVIEWSCRNKFLIIAMWMVITGYGYYAMINTPVDAIPDLSENQVIVFTDWMGRSPKEIEEQITYPLSVSLQGLAGVKSVRSSSEFNFSMINIIFDESVDFYFARTRVLERLALAGTFLPEGVVPYMAPDSTALGQIFWYTVEGDHQDAGTLRGIQDWYVRYQLNSIPGVAQVSTAGGFPKEYQIDVTPERLRAYNVTLGEIYSAVARGNSSVGGRVVHKGNAEYLIRGVGWIKSLDDIRATVITERGGVPVTVGDVAVVQTGSEFRRAVLEKDGKEVTGGVVMMRYGENPLEVTRHIKEKIRELQKGLPEGVRIVPFYDRTRLIESAIETVTRTLEHEIIIAGIAILLILTHFRSVFVVVITLPLSILIAFILMKLFGISSNIMSLSGIAISIGILVDQSIVMLENATHKLTEKFGDRPIRGDTTEIVVAACRQVGRPIFFSVLIMVVSFLPVFALTGQAGKLFHPLAFTKTFALLGTAIISVTLVPAIIPFFIRGRLSKEENNWIIRSVVEMYRPVLSFLMGRPQTVIILFCILLGTGAVLFRHLGGEFMPPLDEGSILDMPSTAPRASVTEVADDLKIRDAKLREMPEVEMVVGKAGRADTPTDPAPLDMVETIVVLRPKEHWLKRKIKMEDAYAESERLLNKFETNGHIGQKFATDDERKGFISSTASAGLDRYDAAMRNQVLKRQMQFDESLAGESAVFVAKALLAQLDARNAWANPLSQKERDEFIASIASRSELFARNPQVADIETILNGAVKTFTEQSRLEAKIVDPLIPVQHAWTPVVDSMKRSLGFERKDFFQQTASDLDDFRFARMQKWAADENKRMFFDAMDAFENALVTEIESSATMQGRWKIEPAVWKSLREKFVSDQASEFGHHAFLWVKTKSDLVRELDTAVQQLGYANDWVQPIINRVNMLATGVRTEVGVLVYGKTPEQIQDVSNNVAKVLREVPGAVDVTADQTVGKGYIEVEIDRERAARYGVNVGDIQDIIEIALGGKTITTTVEGRERYPVRLRYARDFRIDEESIRHILVPATFQNSGTGGMGASASSGGMSKPKLAALAPPSSLMPAVYLADVANIHVIEGPVMIKSENGQLRSYIQLNVRGRDMMSFVEEAMQAVNSRVKLPAGAHVGWSGQFEEQVRTSDRLSKVFPAVLILIFVILYMTYNDFSHAMLMMLAVPGALAGGVIFQALRGDNWSVAVSVGYIACFGMATETGIIMLVYLRDAIAERGGLKNIPSLKALEQAILAGAVHRLRPKLLTEGTAIIGLAPMLWAHGAGAEVMAPMAAPVLGGLLIADEVIDIFLPVLFYQVEAMRWKKLHGWSGSARTESTARIQEGTHS